MMLKDVIKWAESASLDELKASNRVIVLAMRGKMGEKAQQAMQTLRIGQKVKFFHPTRGWIYCTVTKLNTKTATCMEENSIRGWRVSPGTLTAV